MSDAGAPVKAPPSGVTPSTAIRVLVAVALLALLWVTVAAGLAASLWNRAPELALRIAPWDARAGGLAARSLILAVPGEHARPTALATRALRRDATNVSAAVAMGSVADLAGRREGALHFFRYSAQLSRRNLLTHLWWIEYAVMRDDIPRALHHYDVALRATRQARDVLFPVLGPAIADPNIRDALVSVLRGDPAWGEPFFRWLVTNGVDYRSTALLFESLTRAGDQIAPDLIGGLERGLIAQQDYDAAWRVYRQRHPEARADRSRDIGFAASAERVASPFDWNVAEESSGASIGRFDGRTALSFATLATEGGELARQFQTLPPGRYRLRDVVELGAGAGADAPLPYWLLRCVDGRELGRTPLGTPQHFAVPPDCPAQWLILANDAGDALVGREGVVQRVVMEPDDQSATARQSDVR